MIKTGQFVTPLHDVNYSPYITQVAVDALTIPQLREMEEEGLSVTQIEVDEKKLRDAWISIIKNELRYGSMPKPPVALSTFDKLRWKLHRKLIQWKVII